MRGLDPRIHALAVAASTWGDDMDAHGTSPWAEGPRIKSGHDGFKLYDGRRIPGRDFSPPPSSGGMASAAQKKASARISMLSRGRASGGVVGSSKAVWAVQRAQPCLCDS
jgi:hypothetical protein